MGMPKSMVQEQFDMSVSAQQRLYNNATARGWNPTKSLRVAEEHVVDSPRSGRPVTVTLAAKEQVLESVRKDRAGREKSTDVLAYEAAISRSSAHRILKDAVLMWVKPTTKLGL